MLVGVFFVYQSFVVGDKSPGLFQETVGGKGGSALFPSSEFLGASGEEGDTLKQDAPVPTLRQISSAPTAGGIVFNTKEDITIRYIERATGHIFETTDRSLEQNRISNTTIPRIQKSAWSTDGEMVILQYLDENEILKSFYGNVLGDTGVLDGWFLSNNITAIDVHADGDIFYIQKIGTRAEGFISNFDGTNSKEVFSSTLYDWIPLWIGDSVGVVSKAANNVSGFLYQLQSENRIKLVSLAGLIVKMSPDGTKVLLSTSNTSGTRLLIHDLDTEETTTVPFTTLAEKCAWTADSTTFFCASTHGRVDEIVPDSWYTGVISFSDDIWVYNTETKSAQLVYDAEAARKVFDIIDITIDSEQKILMFTDKNDLTLWALTL